MLALEVVPLPVTDIDRALAFYTERDPDGNTWTLQERGHRTS